MKSRLLCVAAVVGVLLLSACQLDLTGEPLTDLGVGPAGAARINDRGIAAGFTTTLADPNLGEAALFDTHTKAVTRLPGLAGFDVALDVNEGDLAVGYVVDEHDESQAALWDPAYDHELTVLPRKGAALAVSEGGLVVGYGTDSLAGGGWRRGFVYDVSTGVATDVGTLDVNGLGTSALVDISENGIAVGYSEIPTYPPFNAEHAVIYGVADGTLTQLPGTRGGSARAISDSGRYIVGEAYVEEVWDGGSIVHDRATGGTTIVDPFDGLRTELHDVNDLGIATGIAWDEDNETFAFAYDHRTGEAVDLGALHGARMWRVAVNNRLEVSGLWLENPNLVTGGVLAGKLRSNPAAPGQVTARGCGSEAILSWSAPEFDGNEPVSAYFIVKDDKVRAGVGPGTTSFTDTTVAPDTTVTYSVVAMNSHGLSPPSPRFVHQSVAC